MRLQLLLLAIGILTITMLLGSAQAAVVELLANDPGIGLVGQRFMIATPIANNGTGDASNVQITGATFGSATLLSPASFPVALGTIGPNQRYIFQTDFDATSLVQGTAYPLTISGTYQLNQVTVNFTLNLQMGLPPASPGSGTTATGMANAEDLSGAPFPDYTIQFVGDNDAFIPVPIGPFVAGNPTLQSVGIQPAQGAQPRQGPQAVSIPTNEDLLTLISNGVAGDPAEPSGGGGGGVVFLSFNWDAAYKADGDTSFTLQNPRTMFPHSMSTTSSVVTSRCNFQWQSANLFGFSSFPQPALAVLGNIGWLRRHPQTSRPTASRQTLQKLGNPGSSRMIPLA